MEEIIVLTGNTVRLEATFMNFEGQNTDPQTVKFIVYDKNYMKISETVLGVANQAEVGKYFFDYVAPLTKGLFYYEWFGEISGNPAIQRGVIQTVFIKK